MITTDALVEVAIVLRTAEILSKAQTNFQKKGRRTAAFFLIPEDLLADDLAKQLELFAVEPRKLYRLDRIEVVLTGANLDPRE